MPKNATKTNSISAKIAQLNQDIEWFYDDDFELDLALAKYQAATKLAEEIEQDLVKLKNSITVVGDFTKDSASQIAS